MMQQKLPLQFDDHFDYPFPSTRYQGSKRKHVEWIWENVRHLDFASVLDVFGGTGVVSHMFKNAGKRVTYNDLLAFNQNIGKALIENSKKLFTKDDIQAVLHVDSVTHYPTFIQDNFSGIYFTDDENAWLDYIVHNIEERLHNQYKKAIARFALFQACIIKRPYNLFHRANLYMRTADVDRSFGNKTTWDTPFETHFKNFVTEANQAVFDNGHTNQAIMSDALETPQGHDLVYIDPPYLNRKGVGVDYRDFYHFLEGIMYYADWANLIDHGSKHKRLKPKKSSWNSATEIGKVFDQLIERHHKSILVVSYRGDGIPSKQQLLNTLGRYKTHVHEASQPKQYALSKRNSHELLLIAP